MSGTTRRRTLALIADSVRKTQASLRAARAQIAFLIDHTTLAAARG